MTKLVVALDFSNKSDAYSMIRLLGSSVSFYKIGTELLTAGGMDVALDLKALGKKVFLDLKLFDIPTTVEKTILSAAYLGMDYVSVHLTDIDVVNAAARAARRAEVGLVGIPLLTSTSVDSLPSHGYPQHVTPGAVVLQRLKRAEGADFSSVVVANKHVDFVALSGLRTFVPGIRLNAESDDQIHSVSPDKLSPMADYAIVGRPITQADDPRGVVELMKGGFL